MMIGKADWAACRVSFCCLLSCARALIRDTWCRVRRDLVNRISSVIRNYKTMSSAQIVKFYRTIELRHLQLILCTGLVTIALNCAILPPSVQAAGTTSMRNPLIARIPYQLSVPCICRRPRKNQIAAWARTQRNSDHLGILYWITVLYWTGYVWMQRHLHVSRCYHKFHNDQDAVPSICSLIPFIKWLYLQDGLSQANGMFISNWDPGLRLLKLNVPSPLPSHYRLCPLLLHERPSGLLQSHAGRTREYNRALGGTPSCG